MSEETGLGGFCAGEPPCFSSSRNLFHTAKKQTYEAHLLSTAGPPEATAYELSTADQGRRQTRIEHAPKSMERGFRARE
jgi:hypothetical protein